MEVILTEDVPKVGKMGDVVRVKDGFGRNFLIPQNKALVSNSKNLKALEAQKKQIAAKAAKLLQTAEAVAAKLQSMHLNIEKEAGTEDRLFGSVTNKEIADLLAEQGVDIDRHKIQLDSPIKTVGDHEVEIKLHSELKVPLKVTVVAKG